VVLETFETGSDPCLSPQDGTPSELGRCRWRRALEPRCLGHGTELHAYISTLPTLYVYVLVSRLGLVGSGAIIADDEAGEETRRTCLGAPLMTRTGCIWAIDSLSMSARDKSSTSV
jgi:hypothetical protein